MVGEDESKTPYNDRKWNFRKQCVAINCNKYAGTNPEVAFHRFPKDPVR